jgi:NAD(P)-dependent dehydrogenase (short-subunit alcohol dehydrogenase family)
MSTFTLKRIGATILTMAELSEQVVIVTGAGRGIGRAHARTLAAHGARVIVNDVAGAHECVERLKADGLTAWADTSDISAWDGARSLISATVSRFGRLDGLVNNAGVLRRADIADLAEADLDLELGVNLKGAFACTRFASEYWRQEHRQGRRPRASVVNTASDTIFSGSPGGAGYAATKAAIVALTQSASLEGAQYGVRHNAIAPSGRTPMAASSGLLAFGAPANGAAPVPDDPADQDPAAPDNPLHNSPLVAWLLSPGSAHVTGQVFRLRFGAVSRMNPTTNGDWLVPPDEAAAWKPDQIGEALNTRVFGSQFPPPMRDFPNQPSVPFSRLDHT